VNHETRASRLLAGALLFSIGLLGGCDRGASTQIPRVDERQIGEDERQMAEELCPPGFPVTLSPGDHEGFRADSESRAFHLLLPQGEPPPRGYPLLVAFHGTTESGRRFVERATLSDFAERRFVVVAPDAAGHGTIWPVWDAMRLPTNRSSNPDLRFFDRLTACLGDRLDIDDTKIFVAGHSAGGIMANRVLRNRAETVAGGITASGLFELTGSPQDPEPEVPQTVIVTWGGANDIYSGATSDGTRVTRFHFAEQAALASQYYFRADKIRHVHCRGHAVGHTWLTALNHWMIDLLLSPHEDEVSPPHLAGVTCSAEAAELPRPPLATPSCDDPHHPQCALVCGLFAECLLGNATLGPALSGLVAQIGVTPTTCQPCLDTCRELITDPVELSFLQCLTVAEPPRDTCGPGIEGALPFIQRLDTCCAQHTENSTCQRICSGIAPDDAAAYFLTTCH
jgi:alpha-beta hydrolase superfamily lysophospholipase